jgi:putative ABC transport system permease protein
VYLPATQESSNYMTLVVRSAIESQSVLPGVEAAAHAINKDLPLYQTRTMDQVLAASIAQQRMSVLVLVTFAAVALTLASIGLYGVVSHGVTERTHEIGVRMALGAQRTDVLRLVVGHAAKLVGIGTAIGLILAFFSTRTLSALLYSVGAFDPATFIFVTIALAAVALLASYIPALRATRADPMIALSHNA